MTGISAAERAFYASLMRADVGALRDALTEDMVFIHHQGILDTKSALLTGIDSGLYRYSSIDVKTSEVTPLGEGLALTKGRIVVTFVDAPELPRTLESALVWQKQADQWTLAAWFTTSTHSA